MAQAAADRPTLGHEGVRTSSCRVRFDCDATPERVSAMGTILVIILIVLLLGGGGYGYNSGWGYGPTGGIGLIVLILVVLLVLGRI